MPRFVNWFAVAALTMAPLSAFADDATYRDALAAARHDIAQGDLHTAHNRMIAAVQEYPNNPDVHLLLAEIDLKLGDSPNAEEQALIAHWFGGNDDEVGPVEAQAMLQQNKLGQLIAQVQPGTRAPASEAAVRRALALAHMGLGQADAAEKLLADAKRLDPDSRQSDIYMARLLMMKGDFAGAETAMEKIRAIDPNSIDVERLEADIQRSKGDSAGALAAYGKALAEHPNDLGLLSGRASILVGLGRLDDAQKDVDAALVLAPLSLTPNFLAGLLDARRGDLRKADDLLTSVSAGFDALPNGYYVLGAVKYALGQYDTAIANLEQYVGRQPNNRFARSLLATAALRMHDPQRAIEVLQPIVFQDPKDTDTIGLLARAYLEANRKDDAIALYRWVANEQPDNVKVKTDAAMMQLGLGDPIAGGKALEKIAASDKGEEVAGPLVVLNDLNNGWLGKASDMVETLVKRNPDNMVTQDILGTVRLAQLRYDDAERVFKGIIAKDPNFLSARRNLAQVYISTNRPGDARAAFNALLQVQPNDAASLTSLADLAASAGKIDEAREWLTKAIVAQPTDPSPSVRLAQLDASQKDWTNALAVAANLVGHFPANTSFVEMLAAMQTSSGNPAAAAATYKVLLDGGEVSVTIFQRWAFYQLAAGNADGARDALRRAMALSPDDEGVAADMVDLDFRTRGEDAAFATARSFETRQPSMSDRLAAEVLVRAGHLDDAIDLLQDGQAWRPTPRNLGRLAELLFQSGKHDEAKSMLEKQLAKTDDVPMRMALANMYLVDHQDDAAQPLYEQALAAAPNEPLALNNLAILYARTHNPRARDLALQAYRLTPGPATADTLGWALVSLGENPLAIPFLEQAAAGLPQDPEVQYHLAVGLQETGALARARTLLEQAVASKDNFTGREDAQRRLQELPRG
jgi:putative PEP-CTERM system TPR-repeat lipoprotein